MFGAWKTALDQFKQLQTMMKDDHVRAVMGHPKIQELFRDPAFQAAVKSKDPAKVMSVPKFAALLRDPELAPLLSKLKDAALRA